MSNKTVYLTVNDAPSGVYKSQVVDVISYLNSELNQSIQLVAFIPVTGFFENKSKIKAWNKKAKVLPMFPKLKFWHLTKVIYNLFAPKGKSIIARGPMAFKIGFNTNANMIYDGRGAVKAELTEFSEMIPNISIVNSIIEAEKFAVTHSDYRIAVSNKLLQYWKDEFGLNANRENSVIIPCLASANNALMQKITREELGWGNEDVVLVYAGGIGGWQSFESLYVGLSELMDVNQRVKVLFLTKENEFVSKLISTFADRVQRFWLTPEQVGDYMGIGDYGILLRDNNRTNSVASPVKFAEYLNAGLKVLISENIGDYSELVVQDDLGIIVQNFKIIADLEAQNEQERERIKKYSRKYTKSGQIGNYRRLKGFFK